LRRPGLFRSQNHPEPSMRSSHSRFISRIVLLALLSGAAAPAFAAAVGPAGGGGAPGGGPGGGGASGGAGPGAGGSGAHSFAAGRSSGCTTDAFGKAVASWFVRQDNSALNAQKCSDFVD
jgi:hypothetical protein